MARAEYRPDHGYAWLVVFACFIINFIMAGLVRAAGVLYIALIDVYGVSREVATTPFSLRFCVRNMSGPLVGALGQRYGVRPVVLVGGLVCGLGGIICALAPSITWITFAWGGVHGLGYGMCNLIHVIIINRYFDKYKGIALGINYTGDGFGTFILPLMLDFLLEMYGLNGTFLILAGLSLNVLPAAMILKTPPWEEDSLSSRDIDGIQQVANNKINKMGTENKAFDMESEKVMSHFDLNLQEIAVPEITFNGEKTMHVIDDGHQVPPLQEKNIIQDSPVQNSLKYSNFFSNEKLKHPRVSDAFMLSEIYSLRESASLRIKDKCLKKKRWSCNMSARDSDRKNSQISVTSCPSHIGKCSKFLHSSRAYPLLKPQNKHLSVQNESNDLRSRSNSFMNETNRLKNEENCTKLAMQIQTTDKTIPLNEKEILASLELALDDMDSRTGRFGSCVQEKKRQNPVLQFIKTNTKPMFLIISATMALYVLLFISVFTIIIDYAKDNDISNEYGKLLIMSFSVTDIIGRLLFGIVLDKKWLSIKYYAGLTTGLMGFFILVIPLFKSFVFWMISFSLCGFVQGGTAIMFPFLVEYYMEKNEESVALGCLNFYGGLLMLPVPPMIGFFRDNVGSYDAVFWIVGALCMFAGSLWIFEPLIVRRQEDRVCRNECLPHDIKI